MSQPSTQSLRDALKEYRDAPNGIGPREFNWRDKPHRVLWDLCDAVEALLPALESALGERQGHGPITGKMLSDIFDSIWGIREFRGKSPEVYDVIAKHINSLIMPTGVELSRDDANIIASNTFNDAELGRLAEPAPAAPTERLRGPLSLEMVQGAIKQATTINPLHNYVRYIDEQKLRDILNDALTAHEAQAVAQARVDEVERSRLLIHFQQKHMPVIAVHRNCKFQTCVDFYERIADLERDLAAIAKETK